MKKLILLVSLLAAYPAYADGEVRTKEDLCEIVRVHRPKIAEYVPGVDVHGKPVVPADLNDGSGNGLMDPVIIPIEINLAERFGIVDLPNAVELKPTVTNIKIHQNGSIECNDRDITKNVIVECQPPEKTVEPVKSDGQKPADAVVSSDKIDGQYPEYNE